MFETLKTIVTETVGLSKDALHVHIGLAIYFVAVLLLGAAPTSPGPMIIVLGVELINEVTDTFHLRHGTWQVWNNDPVKDIVNTMIWPVAILVFFLVRSWWLKRKPNPATSPPPTS